MTFPFIDCQGLGGAWTLGTIQTGEFDLVHRVSMQGGFGDDAVDMNRHLLVGEWEQDSGGTADEWTPGTAAFVCGTPPCFAAGTMVLTATGTRPIEDIQVGDLVYTHKHRWRQVLRVGSKVAETVLVNQMTECTPGHRWYSAPWSSASIDTDVSWVPAERLQGKAIATPNRIRSLADQTSDMDARPHALDDFRWIKCGSVEKSKTQRVYDIEVEEDHSYTADGFVVSNCSGFSNANTTQQRGPGAAINRCMRQLAEYAGHCVGTDGRPGPEIVAFESVQAAYTKGRVLMQALRELLESLTGEEYDLHHVLMSGGSVGAAQYRHRYFPVFARIPFGVDPPSRDDLPDKKTVTYFDAIGDLQGLELTWDAQPRAYAATSEFGRRLADTERVAQHVTAAGRHADAILQVHEAWPAGKYLSEAFDIINVHLPEFERNRKPEGIRRGDSTYKGLQWPLKVNPNKAGYVQTGGCSREFAHWAEPRFLSIRELTRMMGYPDSWRWPEVMTKASAYIGKCCPVDSGRWISGWAARALHGQSGKQGQEMQDGTSEYYYNYTLLYRKWY